MKTYRVGVNETSASAWWLPYILHGNYDPLMIIRSGSILRIMWCVIVTYSIHKYTRTYIHLYIYFVKSFRCLGASYVYFWKYFPGFFHVQNIRVQTTWRENAIKDRIKSRIACALIIDQDQSQRVGRVGSDVTLMKIDDKLWRCVTILDITVTRCIIILMYRNTVNCDLSVPFLSTHPVPIVTRAT